MIRKITILSVLLLSLMMAHAQIPNLTDQKIVDSLFQILPNTKGTDKVDILNQLALNLTPRSYDSSYQYANEALNLAEKLEYQKGKGVAIYNIGNYHYYNFDLNNALKYYLKALTILETFEPCKDCGNLLVQLAAVNQYIRNITKVNEYYRRAAQNYFSIGDTIDGIRVYQALNSAYFGELQTLERIDTISYNAAGSVVDSGLKYNQIVFDYAAGKHHNPGLLTVTNNLFGHYYRHKTNNASKLFYYEFKALEMAKAISDTNLRNQWQGILLGNIGYYKFLYLADLDSGYWYCQRAMNFLRKTIKHDMMGIFTCSMGEIDIARGLYYRAEQYLHQAMNHIDTFLIESKENNSWTPMYMAYYETQARLFRIDAIIAFVKLYESSGDYKKALDYQKKLEEERRIMAKDEMNRQMTGLQVNYEDELQNQQIELASKEKELAQLKLSRARLWFAGGGSVGVIVFLFILLYFQRKKYSTDQNALLLKQRLLRSQMNPHFIFNSLSGIQNFIVTEKPTKASIYLSKFATLVRNILDSSVKEYVTLEKEITTIENYLDLQKVRYANKFDFSIKTDDAIDPETTMIPPMLAQPFIENAIEHGIVHSDKMGQIDVDFRLEKDVILFEVRDNGVGREKARELEAHLEKDHRSMSTAITLERLAMLNKKRKHKIIFEITDLRDSDGNPEGTFVRFGIPLDRKNL